MAFNCSTLLIVDYGAAGRPVGVEITATQAVPLQRLNQLLVELGEPPLAEQDYTGPLGTHRDDGQCCARSYRAGTRAFNPSAQ